MTPTPTSLRTPFCRVGGWVVSALLPVVAASIGASPALGGPSESRAAEVRTAEREPGGSEDEDIAQSENGQQRTETATFSMYCYWTGEATLGRVDGVTASRIGHWHGREVVQVDYDPATTDVSRLADALRRQNSLYAVLTTDQEQQRAMKRTLSGIGRQAEPVAVEIVVGEPKFIDAKHSLRTRHPELMELDLTEAQKIALNAWSHYGGAMPDVLTAEQVRQWKRLREQSRR